VAMRAALPAGLWRVVRHTFVAAPQTIALRVSNRIVPLALRAQHRR
jgi:hypothetical protein